MTSYRSYRGSPSDAHNFPFHKRKRAIHGQVKKIATDETQPSWLRAFELEMLARDILMVVDDMVAEMDLTERIALARKR